MTASTGPDSDRTKDIVFRRIGELPEGVIRRFHEKLLRPEFDPAELMTADELIEAVDADTDGLLVMHGDRIIAGIVVEPYLDGAVQLISYLVVGADSRGQSLGARLLKRGARLHQGRLVVAEIEDPRYWPPTAANDTVGRMRFYRSEGCLQVPVDYLQPSLRPGSPRVRGLLLIVVPSGDEPVPDHASGVLLTDFLIDYFARCEPGVTRADPELARMLAELTATCVELQPLP